MEFPTIIEQLRARADSDEAMGRALGLTGGMAKTNNVGVAMLRRAAEELEAALNALSEIRVTAHCISKAGPLHTPTLAEAWSKFDRLSVMAGAALAAGRAREKS